jgi:hypothetical protein
MTAKPVDYVALLQRLNEATLFDLWRLQAAISRMLEDPARLAAIRRQLHVGMVVRYFAASENRDLTAEIIKIKRSRVLVRHLQDGKHWDLPFYMLNLQEVDTSIRTIAKIQPVDRAQLRVGDRVGYMDRNHQERYGEVIRLNPKTATVQLTSGGIWRVPYALLFDVLEGQTQSGVEGGVLLESTALDAHDDAEPPTR